jgi:hypothetical protein
MIEKFLEKFLPQITERVNENEEVGKALIEALAVLDNYATINNVQFTDEQVNAMLGIVPEPTPEPNADVPAEIVEIVEKKKRGRKPKETANDWNWRFKTEEEFVQEYGYFWTDKLVHYWTYNMNYLFGQKLEENFYTQELISSFKNDNQKSEYIEIKRLGLPNGSSDYWTVSGDMFTNKPLPTAATTQTGWNWRIKTEQELIEEYGIDYKSEIWYSTGKDYLLGQPIIQTPTSEKFIQEYAIENKKVYERDDLRTINTLKVLGITSDDDDDWIVSYEWLTNKPLPTAATTTTWNWRFKTEEEFKQEYGDDWREDAQWSVHGGMDYLFGEEIAETSNSRGVINLLKRAKPENYDVINTFRELGISSGDDDEWILQIRMLTNDPLPTTAAPAKTPAKRGRKPKASSNWSWRFKTEQELREEYGDDYWYDTNWSSDDTMDYLFGQEIAETPKSRDLISKLQRGVSETTNTFDVLGITSGGDDEWSLTMEMLTIQPLPTAAAPKKRGRKPKSELPQIDLGGLEDIGDIDIGDIDFDNLVI